MSNSDDPLEDQEFDNLEGSQIEECPSEPTPKLPNFLTQVLYSIQQLKTKFRRGVTITEIVTYMKDKFNTSGDVWSRVETAVTKANEDGFLLETKSKYTMVAPLARLQNAKTHESRKSIAKELHRVFLYKGNLKDNKKGQSRTDKKPCKKGTKGTASPGTSGTGLTKENILALLGHIETVLLEHLDNNDDEDEQSECPSEDTSVKSKNSKLIRNYSNISGVISKSKASIRVSRKRCRSTKSPSRSQSRSFNKKRKRSGGSKSKNVGNSQDRCHKKRRAGSKSKYEVNTKEKHGKNRNIEGTCSCSNEEAAKYRHNYKRKTSRSKSRNSANSISGNYPCRTTRLIYKNTTNFKGGVQATKKQPKRKCKKYYCPC